MTQLFSVFFLYVVFQEASKRNNNWLPPPWAIVALIILGFNEFMTLLRYYFFTLPLNISFELCMAILLLSCLFGNLSFSLS